MPPFTKRRTRSCGHWPRPYWAPRSSPFWEVTMRAGQRGPQHEVDREQVWTVLAGEFRVTVDDEIVTLRSGDALRLAPRASRQIAASTDARAMVSSPARPTVTTTEGGSQVLPWGSSARQA